MEASHPICLLNACLQQGYNLCLKVAPWGAPVWQADWQGTHALKPEGVSNEIIFESHHTSVNNP